MAYTYKSAVTNKASEILEKECRRYKPWLTRDVLDLVLDLCDERKDLKKRRYEEEEAEDYRKANKRFQMALRKVKEDWIDTQCKEIGACLNKNNSKKAFQMVKVLASKTPHLSRTSLGNVLKKTEIPSRWTEYCSDLYNYESMVTIQFWIAVSIQRKIFSQFFARKLRSQ